MQIVKSNVETLYRPIPNAAACQPRWYKSRQRGIVNSIMRYGQFPKSPTAGRGVTGVDMRGPLNSAMLPAPQAANVENTLGSDGERVEGEHVSMRDSGYGKREAALGRGIAVHQPHDVTQISGPSSGGPSTARVNTHVRASAWPGGTWPHLDPG